MIKGTLFSKLLKQLLFISLISCFILLGNFSSAYLYSSKVSGYINPGNSEILPNKSTENGLLSDGNFFDRSFVNFWNNQFGEYALGYIFKNDGIYFMHGLGNWQVNKQGFLTKWQVCTADFVDEIPGTSDTQRSQRCDSEFVDIDLSLLTNIEQVQFWNFKVETNLTAIMCFVPDLDDNVSYCVSCGYNSCPSVIETNGTLFDSTNYDDREYWESVGETLSFQGGGGSGGSNVVSLDCTYNEIFNFLNLNGYNDYLCYGGLDNFNLYDSTLTYSPVPGSGKTLGQILSYSNSWDTPNDWFVFWNGLYLDKNNSIYNSMWESYPAVYRTWFDLYYRYGGSTLIFDSVREYCAMKQLDVDFDTTLYKGQYFKNTCNTIRMSYGTGDSSNVVGVDWDGVGNHGSGSTVSNDPVIFIQNFFGQLKDNFPTRYDLGGGFLPVYIITFLCAIVLFRFLSH